MSKVSEQAGDWQGLDSLTQAPRYDTIANMLRKFDADTSVLDVGCGEAMLHDRLPKNTRYVGIERSEAAARTALKRTNSDNIIHTAAENFDSCGERFDSIVFNEMLYYTDDPIGLLKKYARFLKEGGVILCSIYQKSAGTSFKSRLLHCFDRRRPVSNIHCEKMVRTFMANEAWPILEDQAVAMWHIWLTQPRSSPAIRRAHRRASLRRV
jgi:SAM-dependent methyltransferase